MYRPPKPPVTGTAFRRNTSAQVAINKVWMRIEGNHLNAMLDHAGADYRHVNIGGFRRPQMVLGEGHSAIHFNIDELAAGLRQAFVPEKKPAWRPRLTTDQPPGEGSPEA
jgi:hypothetical protein